jgi:hypothetical protein
LTHFSYRSYFVQKHRSKASETYLNCVAKSKILFWAPMNDDILIQRKKHKGKEQRNNIIDKSRAAFRR